MEARCSECGDTTRLNARGVCAYRGGCEHRQLQHAAEMARLLAEMDARDAQRTRACHPSAWGADEATRRFLRDLREGYSGDDSD